MNCNLVFDLETIPQQSALSEAQLIEFRKKIEYKYNGTTPIDEVRKLILAGVSSEDNTDVALYEEKARMVRATNPYLGQIVCIGMMAVEESAFGANKDHIQKFALTGNEEKIINEFWAYVAQDKRFRFISYNGLGFDIPWIIKRSMKYGIRPTDPSFLYTKRYQRWPHFDVMQILADWDSRATVRIELACETFGIPSPKDGDIKADTVEKAYQEGNIKGIEEYCIRDLDATYNLFKLLDSYQPNN